MRIFAAVACSFLDAVRFVGLGRRVALLRLRAVLRLEDHGAPGAYGGPARGEPAGMQVEPQDPDRRAGQRQRQPRDEGLRYLWQERARPERRRRDRSDAGGETVKSVDEVERDVHADDPETREGD